MKAYHQLVARVLEHGVKKENRTGTDAISSFAESYRVDLSEGFPLLTTKKMMFRSIILELLWYLRGESHIRWLRDENDCHIWDAWADEEGNVGPIYPVLWRRFPFTCYEEVDFEGVGGAFKNDMPTRKEFDQIQYIIDQIKENPTSRRLVLSAWHPGLLDQMALPPCHIMAIFNITDGKLNCHLTQRSGDIALGIPFNLACYAALTMIIARQTGYEPGIFAHTIVDAHIYENHVDGLKKQLEREPFPLPTLEIADKSLDKLSLEDFTLHNYQHHEAIRFEVAV
ncbi:thymidylate synthase [Cyclonatronum proteinivorum]|uniref:Thymidylate synthase n=1 Tax=Cyclonatronum proteinivorum TaxID=1457365 RepID=A0A345UM41_9BACT|nr:thymidylate synthase [Cyclonatronum proteinivorum]AXJ01543.1 thymidylate synthase [Cyclonatronum proteinivorum]